VTRITRNTSSAVSSAVRPILIFVSCALLASIGCYVQSIQPLYTDDIVAFAPELVGTWVADEDEEYVFTVSDTTRGTYTLIGDEAGATARFGAVLLELGGAKFLDIYPEAPENKNSFYMDHLLRVHNILRVELDADTLWAADFDAEWLQTAAEKKKINIPHIPFDGAILLTASTKELQAFVGKYAKTREAFSEPAKFVRSH
jgi:hypothetical protein